MKEPVLGIVFSENHHLYGSKKNTGTLLKKKLLHADFY